MFSIGTVVIVARTKNLKMHDFFSVSLTCWSLLSQLGYSVSYIGLQLVLWLLLCAWKMLKRKTAYMYHWCRGFFLFCNDLVWLCVSPCSGRFVYSSSTYLLWCSLHSCAASVAWTHISATFSCMEQFFSVKVIIRRWDMFLDNFSYGIFLIVKSSKSCENILWPFYGFWNIFKTIVQNICWKYYYYIKYIFYQPLFMNYILIENGNNSQ